MPHGHEFADEGAAVIGKMHDGPGGQGLSRKAIMEQIDASLTRLGTDYVDLYLIHRFDPETPAEETMEALHDVVKAGKARYLGASSMFAWLTPSSSAFNIAKWAHLTMVCHCGSSWRIAGPRGSFEMMSGRMS